MLFRSQEKNAKADRRAKSEIRAAEEIPEQEVTDATLELETNLEKKAPLFSQEEAHELEELLRTIIGNRV